VTDTDIPINTSADASKNNNCFAQYTWHKGNNYSHLLLQLFLALKLLNVRHLDYSYNITYTVILKNSDVHYIFE